MKQHGCDAIVITCIDFRFQNFLKDWLNKSFKNKKYDLVSFAGSTKNFTTIHKQIDISEKLHYIKEAFLVHHEDCGAYGKESTKKRHVKDLHVARAKILKHHPELTVTLYYLKLDGNFVKIE